jgi:hypothetical protein
VSLVRVLRTASAVLVHTFEVDEVLTDAAGAVTVAVKRLDGTPIAGSPFTASHDSTGVYSLALPGQAQLDALTADWAATVAGATVTMQDLVEVVGGFLFGLREARSRPPALPAAKYSTAELAARRIEVEIDAELICRTTFVPRYKRYALSGRGGCKLLTPVADLRVLRSVRVDGVAWSQPQVDAVRVWASGVLELYGGYWPYGERNVIVEVEHGLDYSPPPITTAGITHLRSLLSSGGNSSVPENALSWSAGEGGIYRISTPAKDRVGIPAVDGIYSRWGQDLGGFA